MTDRLLLMQLLKIELHLHLKNHKGKVNGKPIHKLTDTEIEVERKKWNSRTKNLFKAGGFKARFEW